MSKKSRTPSRQAPSLYDSDLIYLAIKRMTAIADKMAKKEYDEVLDALMIEATEFFDWAAFNIGTRAKQQAASDRESTIEAVEAMQSKMPTEIEDDPADPGPYVSTYPSGNKLADEAAEEAWNTRRKKLVERDINVGGERL